MRTVIRWLGAILFGIEMLANRGQRWINQKWPPDIDELAEEIEEYLTGALDNARVDRYIDAHRPGMPPRGRR